MNLTLILIGVVLILDTIFILGRSNVNMGVIMPALMGIPPLVIGVFYAEAELWLHQGAGNVVRWVLIAGYSAMALLIIVCTLLIRREIRREIPGDADAVIVLGAAVHGKKPSLALQNRLNIAAEHLRTHENCIAVLSGGKGPQEEITEAEAMFAYLLEEGIPEKQLVCEASARSTYENFLFSKELLEKRFPDGYKAVFATSDFHIFRAKIAAKRAGLGSLCGMGCPSPFYIVPNYYIRESMAILRYALLGLR